MFQRLKEKWQLTWPQFILVFTTFALGGSLCGFTGRRLMALTGIERGILYVIVYVLVMTLIWPLCVILVSIPFGQFDFFRNYLHKIWNRLTGLRRTRQLAVFASGTGTNAEKLLEYFKHHATIRIALIVCNKPGARVLQVAAAYAVPVLLIEREAFFEGDGYVPVLRQKKIDGIVLSGFLWKVPVSLIRAYPGRIINIHPALLPNYGGKGMYGMKVHEAVLAAGDKQSGITIHYVNERFDEGETIFQASCAIDQHDTPDSLAQKVHALEHRHFAGQVEKVFSK